MSRIFYVITKSEAGGAQTHLSQLVRFMKSSGHQVAVMGFPGGWLHAEVESLGVSFYPNPFLSNSINPLGDLRAAARLLKSLSEFRPDLVSCHSSKAGFICRLAVRNRIPTVFTAHGWGFPEQAPLLRRNAVLAAERLAARYCKKIICVSNFDRKLALAHGIAPEQKLVTIHNGVELDGSGAALKRDEHSLVRIIFVGRLAAPKNPELLLEAFCNLPEVLQRQAHLEIIGDGPKRKALQQFVTKHKLGEKITLRGALSRADTLEALSKADLFVLVSYYEGFPLSVLEAMSVGHPIVATQVGGVSEAVTPECGVLVPAGNSHALRQALEAFLQEPQRIKTMGSQAKERAAKHFSIDVMLEKTLRVYQDALG